MHIEEILYLQLHNLNFQACVDGRHSLEKGRRKGLISHMIFVDKIVHQIPIIYTSLNSNPARSFNI